MITLKDSIEIQAAPEKVFEWLVQRFESKENYQAWHPDHVDIRWIKGEPLQEGSIVYAEEYLHGQLHKLKFRITRVIPNKEIEYRALFPLSLFAPGNAFIIEPKGKNGCIFTATGRLRVGPLFKKLGKKQIEATKQHMKEEGENIDKLTKNQWQLLNELIKIKITVYSRELITVDASLPTVSTTNSKIEFSHL